MRAKRFSWIILGRAAPRTGFLPFKKDDKGKIVGAVWTGVMKALRGWSRYPPTTVTTV